MATATTTAMTVMAPATHQLLVVVVLRQPAPQREAVAVGPRPRSEAGEVVSLVVLASLGQQLVVVLPALHLPLGRPRWCPVAWTATCCPRTVCAPSWATT